MYWTAGLCAARKGVVEIESEWTARDRDKQAQGGAKRLCLIPEPALSQAEGLAPKERARTWATSPRQLGAHVLRLLIPRQDLADWTEK